MTKAIIFDCFGVLVGGSLEQFIESYLSHDEELVRKAHRLNDESSLGLISYEQVVAKYAELAGVTDDQVYKEMDNNPRNERLLNYIKNNLKDKFKIGFLSNASDNWLNELFLEEDLKLFDDFVLSYEVRMAKPDERIYELSASRLSVNPEECIFVDDIERYCSAAVDTGMKSVQYKTFGNFVSDFEKILADSNK